MARLAKLERHHSLPCLRPLPPLRDQAGAAKSLLEGVLTKALRKERLQTRPKLRRTAHGHREPRPSEEAALYEGARDQQPIVGGKLEEAQKAFLLGLDAAMGRLHLRCVVRTECRPHTSPLLPLGTELLHTVGPMHRAVTCRLLHVGSVTDVHSPLTLLLTL